MDIKQLSALGGFSPRGLIKKEVELKRPPLKPKDQWDDPDRPESDESAAKDQWTDDTLTVYVRKRSSADSFEVLGAESRNRPFVMIYRCICDAQGKPVFESQEQVEELKEWLWMPLALAVSEVNQLLPKKLQPRTNSGAKSRLPSAADPSRNGKKPSLKRKQLSGVTTELRTDP